MGSPYEQDLGRNPANCQPLTPLSYLERAAKTFPDHVAIIHGRQRTTYRDFWRRSLKLASALSRRGIGKGDTVTVSGTVRNNGRTKITDARIAVHMGTGGPLAGTTLPLRASGTLIGRSPECALVLDDDYASGRHARIFQGDDGTWQVEDLRSTNGTFLGATRLTEPREVAVGSVLRIGQTVVELQR